MPITLSDAPVSGSFSDEIERIVRRGLINITPGPVRGMESRSRSDAAAALGNQLNAGLSSLSVDGPGFSPGLEAIDRERVAEALAPYWALELPPWAASPDRLGQVLPGTIVSDDPARASEEPFPEPPDPRENERPTTPGLIVGTDVTVVSDLPSAADRPLPPFPTPDAFPRPEGGGTVAFPLPGEIEEAGIPGGASPGGEFLPIPLPGAETIETGGPRVPSFFPTGGDNPFGDVIGGLGQVLLGEVIDRSGLGLSNPFTEGGFFSEFDDADVPVIGPTLDTVSDFFLGEDPMPTTTAMAACRPRSALYTQAEVFASCNPREFSPYGVVNGQPVFTRRRRRRRAPVTKSQMDAVAYFAGVFGKGSETTKLAVAQILAK